MNRNEPVWKLQQGSLSAAAWINTRKAGDGEYEQLSVRVERRYKDRDDRWQSTNSYSVQELLQLRHFLGHVIDRALEEQRQERGEAA